MSPKIAGAAFACGVFLPAARDIRCNASVQLVISGANHIHKPRIRIHNTKAFGIQVNGNTMADSQLTESSVSQQDQWLNLSHINREFRAIAQEKSWQVYHTPKNIASAIAVESSELLAEFQWLTADESASLSADKKASVANEVADILMYMSELCEQLQIDVAHAVNAKIAFNKQRFIEED